MNLYLIIILLIVISGIGFSNINFKNSLKKYVIFCSLVLAFFVMACSANYGASIGLDTIDYFLRFNTDIHRTFEELWDEFLNRYYFRTNSDYDIGYVLLEWIVGRITGSFYLFKLVASTIVLIPFSKLVCKFSNSLIDVCFAYIFFICFLYTGLLVGARQTFALGLCIAALLSFLNKDYKYTIVYIILAATLHMSSLLIAIPLLLSFLSAKTIRVVHGVVILLIPIIMFSANAVIMYMGNIVGVERYVEYGTGELMRTGTTYILLSSLLSLYCFFITNIESLKENWVKCLYAMVPVFTLFSPLIYANGAMIRITHYSMVFLTVFIPQITKIKFGLKARTILTAMIVALSIFLLKDGHLDYSFFWNDVTP